MTRLGWLAMGAFVPEPRLTNQDLEKMVDTTDAWIVQRTGIRERRIAPRNMHPSDMAVAAARNCLQGLGIRPDLVIASSGSCERIYPYQASIVANRLGLKDLPAFDISAACSGSVYSLAIASSLMTTAGYRNALLTASEKMSAFTDYKDRRSCILFGDGASAMLLSRENWEHELLATEMGCDPGGCDLVTMGEREGNPHFWQDGQKVFKFAVTIISQLADRLREKAGLGEKDSFYIVPHQANLRVLQAVADLRKMPMDRFVTNIERYGNTSSASIGLALEEAGRTGRFQKGDYVFLIGFGGGLSWAGAALRW